MGRKSKKRKKKLNKFKMNYLTIITIISNRNYINNNDFHKIEEIKNKIFYNINSL